VYISQANSHENPLPFVCEKPVKMLVKRCEFAMKKIPKIFMGFYLIVIPSWK